MPQHSTPTTPRRKAYYTPNEYRVEGDTAYLTLTDPQGYVTGEAILDSADLERTIAFGRWHRQVVQTRNRTFEYVVSYVRKTSPEYRKRNQRLFLHRLVMGAAPGEQVDHWDGNCLDCRKGNLRIVTPSENSLNRHFHRRIAILESENERLRGLLAGD